MTDPKTQAKADAAAERARAKAMRPWFKKKRFILPAALLALVVVAGVAGSSKKTPPPAPAASDNGSAAAPTTAQTTATSVSTAPLTLIDLSGTGTKSTQKFTASQDWDLAWSYDCSAYGGTGNFQVYVNGPLVSPVNQLGASGSGVEHYHEGGSTYLEVNSECSWHIKATTA